MSKTRGGGYWIGPEEGLRRVVAPPGDELLGDAASGNAPLDDAAHDNARGPSAERTSRPGGRRRGRRVASLMVTSVVVLVALAILTALTLTGRIVIPVISAKLFPIHYQEEIAQAAAKYGQDPYFVAAMVRAESGYDAQAKSGSGAVGLMQLMPATAEWVASKSKAWPEGESPVLTDPVDSLELGVWYIDYLGDMYGQGGLLALAAYNAGLGNVDEWIEEAGGPESFDVSDIPFPETRQHVERVQHYKELYERIHPDVFSASAP